jgi:hypothetical protein
MKSLWKKFKLQFSDIENNLQDQKSIIDREVLVASETAAFRERQEASLYRRDGIQFRDQQVQLVKENRNWQIKLHKRLKGMVLLSLPYENIP